MDQAEDLVEALQTQARIRPDDVAFTFLVDGDAQEANLTFGELDRRARSIGAFLQAKRTSGPARWDARAVGVPPST
jgi:acyl-CoA synthetase (AMP-forming)/AMP-acid ligase II